jgi:hypothetical protein
VAVNSPTASIVHPLRLLTPVPEAEATPMLYSERAESVELVALDIAILGFSAFTVNIGAREYVAQLVHSERHAGSEMFQYRLEGETLLSTFTKFDDGTVLGWIQAGGKGHFISPDEKDYLVVSSVHTSLPEVIRYPSLMGRLEESVDSAAATYRKRRAARSGPPAPRVPLVIAVDDGYERLVGSKEKAAQRVTHYVDRQNTAFRNSGFEGRLELREVAFFDLPDLPAGVTVFQWAIDPLNPVIRMMRKRNKAAGTIIFSGSTRVNEALRTAPAPVNPDIVVAVVGGFFADWDATDIHTALHEMGHLSGGDHNPESAQRPADDPQASARDWYDCGAGVYGALSYNVCGKFLDFVEMYSGLAAVYDGKVRGIAGKQDNVGTFRLVFEYLKGDHE